MTALTEYSRLECAGLWRTDAASQRRDVVVSFGDATLVLSDSADRPLTHWSLAAIDRINPGERPALFTPDPAGDETLEIQDDLMIDAMEKVRKSLARRRPKPGFVRLGVAAAIVTGISALAVFWLPGAMINQAKTAVTHGSLRMIDAGLVTELEQLTGPACNSPLGLQALAALRARLGLSQPVIVVPGQLPSALALPGGTLVLDRDRVETPPDPAATAGYLIEAQANQAGQLEWLLSETGTVGTVHLMTTGTMRQKDLRSAARTMAAHPGPAPDIDQLRPAFAASDVPQTPWAEHKGIVTSALIANDITPQRQVLRDGDWVALQSICGF